MSLSQSWLIDLVEQSAHVYKTEESAEILEKPGTLSGDPVLPGCVIDLKPIWEPGF